MLIHVPDCSDDVLQQLIDKWATRATAQDAFATSMATSLLREAARRQARSTLGPATDTSQLPTLAAPGSALSTLASQAADKVVHRGWRDTRPLPTP